MGILACAGQLPLEIAAAARAAGRPIHIVAIEGFADDAVKAYPHERVRLGQIGRMLASFARAGVGQITIAGAMQRPNLLTLRVDRGFFANLPAVLALTRGGDDTVLRRVVAFFEGHGLKVAGVSEVAPALLASEGPMALRVASAAELAAWQRAARLARDLGPFDVGQAIVASADAIVAVEGVRGTDAMLRDLGPDGLGTGLGRGGVLLKLAKPGQEMRVDVPTIGPETVRLAHAAGLTAIGVGAGGTIVLEREKTVATADRCGMALVGLRREIEKDDGGAAAFVGEADAGVPVMGDFIARRTPTPGDRRDLRIGRAVLEVVKAHGAGGAVIVSREHVLGVRGQLPLVGFVAAQRTAPHWGRRLLKGRLGVLVIDEREEAQRDVDGASHVIKRELAQAAMDAGLAGVAVLGSVTGDEARLDATAWANEAKLFLVAYGAQP
ncbi:MAG: UDP-2,3-diacylglucosamine diphosphatase LpxI [Hyphomicrobiaceae bacterium]